MNNKPTTEDRIWAVISHLSALAFGMGFLLPIIGWSEQRRKSNYASFQCLQALGYQSLGYTVWLLACLLVVIVFVAIMLAALSFTGDRGTNIDNFMGIWMSILLFIVLGSLGLYFLLPVIAAVACALGRDFRYPIMGNRLAYYLGYESTNTAEEPAWLIEDHEDRWVASMGHFSIIIAIWGLLAPVTALLMQGKRKSFLKSQSVQTLIYQAGATILYFSAGFVYLFGTFLFFATAGLSGKPDLSSPFGIFGITVFFVSLLMALGIGLAMPLFHILGQWAGYRVLKGDDYRYPLIGRLVDRWLRS